MAGRDLYLEHWTDIARGVAGSLWARRPDLGRTEARAALWLKTEEPSRGWLCVVSSDAAQVGQDTKLSPPDQPGLWACRAEGEPFLGVRFDQGEALLALSVERTQALPLEPFLDLAERCYLEAITGRLTDLCGGLLDLLSFQRTQIGHQLHRGPAQGLTAARLELSLLDEAAQDQVENLRQALESAGSDLREIVHGPLRPKKDRGPNKEPGLSLGNLWKEIVSTQNWNGRALPSAQQLEEWEQRMAPFRLSKAERALLEAWTLLGGEAREDEQDSYRLERPR